MTLTYLISAHKNPIQLKRLVDKLNTNNSKFYIHIDLKSNLDDFINIIKNENVFFIKERLDCIWGDFSLVQVTLALMKAALLDNIDSYFIFLSGQCYPIKSNIHIHDFLEINKDVNFISISPSEKCWDSDECNRRFNYYKINLSSKRGDYYFIKPGNFIKCTGLFLRGKVNFITAIKMLRKKEVPFELYGGSNWWGMNGKTLNEIHEYIHKNNKIDNFFKFVSCSDEVYFQSIIMDMIKKGNLIKYQNSITYVDWHRKGCELPVTFDHRDYLELINQPDEFLFARKFDTDYDEKILNMLDSYIIN